MAAVQTWSAEDDANFAETRKDKVTLTLQEVRDALLDKLDNIKGAQHCVSMYVCGCVCCSVDLALHLACCTLNKTLSNGNGFFATAAMELMPLLQCLW